MVKKAVVLMSDGMDSAVCTAIALKMGFELAALHLNYGQRTQNREKKAFVDLIKFFGITEILEVDVSYFSQIGSSSLTDRNIPITNCELRIAEDNYILRQAQDDRQQKGNKNIQHIRTMFNQLRITNFELR